MNRETLRELREAVIGTNGDGDFIFTYKKEKKTRTYGPYSFEQMMDICKAVRDDYEIEMKRRAED